MLAIVHGVVVFLNNYARAGGGGAICLNYSEAALGGSVILFINNSAMREEGGALKAHISRTMLKASCLYFAKSLAVFGGAIYSNEGWFPNCRRCI